VIVPAVPATDPENSTPTQDAEAAPQPLGNMRIRSPAPSPAPSRAPNSEESDPNSIDVEAAVMEVADPDPEPEALVTTEADPVDRVESGFEDPDPFAPADDERVRADPEQEHEVDSGSTAREAVSPGALDDALPGM
jgi:hypothetical protein